MRQGRRGECRERKLQQRMLAVGKSPHMLQDQISYELWYGGCRLINFSWAQNKITWRKSTWNKIIQSKLTQSKKLHEPRKSFFINFMQYLSAIYPCRLSCLKKCINKKMNITWNSSGGWSLAEFFLQVPTENPIPSLILRIQWLRDWISKLRKIRKMMEEADGRREEEKGCTRRGSRRETVRGRRREEWNDGRNFSLLWRAKEKTMRKWWRPIEERGREINEIMERENRHKYL